MIIGRQKEMSLQKGYRLDVPKKSSPYTQPNYVAEH
jgi:hypothetical protein